MRKKRDRRLYMREYMRRRHGHKPRSRSCECGQCKTCKNREYKRLYYAQWICKKVAA